MKVLIAAHHYPPTYGGGAEWRTHRTAHGLQQAGHDVRVVCVESITNGSSQELLRDETVEGGVAVQRLSFAMPHSPQFLDWEYRNPLTGRAVGDLIEANRPDVLHLISGYLMSGSAIEAAQARGVPVVLTLTDFWFLCPRINLLRSDGTLCATPADPLACALCLRKEQRRYRLPDRWSGGAAGQVLTSVWQARGDALVTALEQRASYLRSLFQQVDVVISPSQFLIDLFAGQGWTPRRFLRMRQGLDRSGWAEAGPAEPNSHLRIGYVGQIAAHKGVDLLVDAYCHLRAADRPLQLLLYGDGEQFPHYTRELRRRTAGRSDVIFAGRFDHSQVRQVYAGIDLLVVPSRWYENSPNVILEAFANNTPVVVAALGGMAELVDEGTNGLHFQAGSAQALRQVLQRAVDQPALIEQLGQGTPPVKTIQQEIRELEQLYAGLGPSPGVSDGGAPPDTPSGAAGQAAARRDFTSTVARNSAFVIATQVVLKILAFLFNVYIVRRLGAEHFGQYAAVMAFVAIFAILSDLGMAPYMLREIARERGNVRWLLPNVVVLRMLLSGGVVAVTTAAAYALGKEPDMVLGIFIGACGLFLYALQGPLDATLMAWERLDYTATFSLLSQVVFWGLGTLALLTGWGFVGLLLASLVSVGCLALLEGWVVLRQLRLRELTLAPRRWGELVRAGLPFGISSMSFSLQGRFDTALMSIVLTDTIVGWYNVPLQLVHMSMLLAQSVCTAMFPSLTRAYSEDPQSIVGIVHRALKYLLMISLPIAVGTTIIAEPLTILLYTDEFLPSAPLLRILIWTVPLLFLAELMGALIMALKQEKAGARINIVNALISVALNLALVPTVGAMGAALATLSGRGIRVAQYWRLLGSELLVGKQGRELLRVVLAAGAMGAVLFLLRQQHLLLLIGVGALLYCAFLFAFRAIEPQELGHLLGLLLKRGSRSPAAAGSGSPVET